MTHWREDAAGPIPRVQDTGRRQRIEAGAAAPGAGVGKPSADIGDHMDFAEGVVKANPAGAAHLDHDPVGDGLAGNEVEIGNDRRGASGRKHGQEACRGSAGDGHVEDDRRDAAGRQRPRPA